MGEAGWPGVLSPSVLIRLSSAYRPLPFLLPLHPGNPEQSPPIIHLDWPLGVWGPSKLAQRLMSQGPALRKKGGQGTVSSALLLSSEPPEPRTLSSFTPHAGCPGTGWSLVTWKLGGRLLGLPLRSVPRGPLWPLAQARRPLASLCLTHGHRRAACWARPPLRRRELR